MIVSHISMHCWSGVLCVSTQNQFRMQVETRLPNRRIAVPEEFTQGFTDPVPRYTGLATAATRSKLQTAL